MQAILKRDEPQYGVPRDRWHSCNHLRIYAQCRARKIGYPEDQEGQASWSAAFPQAMQSQPGQTMMMEPPTDPLA
jgi:hypothetical protein